MSSVSPQDDFISPLRNALLNETLLSMGLVSIPALILSLGRIPVIGWRPVFGVHILLLLVTWGFWLQRDRIPFFWRLGAVLAGLGISGVGGFLQHGPAAVAGQFVLLFLVVSVLFLEGRAAFFAGLGMISSLAMTAAAAVGGVLSMDINYPVYARDPMTWVLLLIAIAGYGGFVAFVIWRLLHQLIDHDQRLQTANLALAARTRDVEDADRVKREILSNMGHEFRTPLNGILGMAELLRLDEQDPERRQWLENLEQSARGLGTMLERMLEFVRLGDGEIRIRQQPFHLDELARFTVERFRLRAAAKGLALGFESAPDVPAAVNGDGTLVQRLLTELLENALSFTATGSIAVRLEVVASPETDHRCWVRMTVADTGCGIEEGHLGTIFEPFRQVDGSVSRRVGGTGLGLAICHRIAHLLGGDIRVVSAVDKGSTFMVTLPTDRIAA